MYWTCNKHIHDVFRFPSVVRIDLSLCAAVTDLSPLASLRALRSLDLNWCRGLQPASLAALSCLTRLTHLDLSGCPDAVTDDGLPLIAGEHYPIDDLLGHMPTYLSLTLARSSAAIHITPCHEP